MIAIQGGRADAYGILAGAPVRGMHLVIVMKQKFALATAPTITFSAADVLGTFRQPGHPGVIGIWLTGGAVTGSVDFPDGSSEVAAFSTAPYTVTEAAGDAGYMVIRGYSWAPPGKHAYP